MLSNTHNIQKLSLMTKRFSQILYKIVSRILHTAKECLSLGISGRQWVASLLICMLLSPLFSLPVRAATVVNATESGADNFEPVNAPQWFWESAYYSLNTEIEEWITSTRNGSAVEGYNGHGKDNTENDKVKSLKPGSNEAAKNGTDKTKSNIDETGSAVSLEKEISSASALADAKNAESSETSAALKIGTENRKAPNSVSKAGVSAKNSTSATALLVSQLPDSERESIYSYENNLGSPAGQVEMDSPNEAAATKIRHRAGIANFSFGVSLASLTGRGIDAGAAMTYNSRTWNQSCTQYDSSGNCAQKHFTYDVEQSWIAPGFSTGFGYLESSVQPLYYNGSIYSYKTIPTGLIEPDGTRRQLYCREVSGSACLGFETSDGSFIRISGEVVGSNPASATFNAVYPDGSKVYYAGAFGSGNYRKHYPVVLQDNNGNRVRVAYKSDQSGRIDYINDTLNRVIKFHYGTDAAGNANKLVAVTIPGMNANQELHTVRFYYQNLTLNAQTAFSGQVTADTAPIQVLRFVYFPATKTGFKYDYHPNYGMIKKITRLVGMSVSDATATTATGTVTSEGTWAATTEYDFPNGSTAISDVPKYTKRTDDWQGRTSATAAETFYDAPEPAADVDRVSRISVKDKEYNSATNVYTDFETINETVSYNAGDWMTGLIKETSVKKKFGVTGQFTTVMAKTKYFWEQGQANYGRRKNPILRKVEITNDAGQTKTTRYEYDQYNNQTAIEEYDFGKNETNATPLRRTETAYETSAGWINANLLSLVKSVQTKVGGVVVSKTLYEYDNNGSDATITRRDDIDIATHDTYYNPAHPAWTERVCPDGSFGDASQSNLSDPGGCRTIYHPGYGSASAYRGNVTKIGRMLDVNATTITDTSSDKTDYNYDIAGNLVSATLSCCQLKTLDYGASFTETGYAYPVKEIKGTSPQLVNEIGYNKNTGLATSFKDENGQITTYEYETDTLRQKKVTYPNGGYILVEYSDKLVPDPISYTRTTALLEAGKTAQSYNYFDGRGSGIRSATQTPDGWSVSAIEYDALGRAKKSYNPFYASTPTGAVPAGTKFTEVLNTDSLGRTTQIRLQDNTTAQTVFNGTVVTVTDQAGKQRRRGADALGRIVRVDEPDSNGNLDVNGNPAQPTVYEYDDNDNLKKIIQTEGGVTQTREFKYDSLSRLTHERQTEATPTLDINGVKGAPAPTKWTKVLKYSTHGLLEEGTDSRGVKTTFSYDGLNRIGSVTFSDGTPAVTYTYDQARTGFFNKGALTRVETAAGDPNLRPDTPATATELDYDNMGRVRQHRQSIGAQTYNLEYGYNLAGQLISEKYPSGKIINFGYDASGRLSSISDASRTYANGFQYQTNGGMLSAFNSGNGTTQSFGFNDRLQMNLQELKRGTEVVQKYAYGYGQIDAAGNLDVNKNNGQLARVESYIGANKQWTKKYSYDSIGRLSKEEELRGDNSNLVYRNQYDYDRFGNLYRKQANNANSLPYTPIEENTDISKSTNRFTTNIQYDDAGNVIQDTKLRNQNYGYDANGRMYKTNSTLSADQSNAVYDAGGQRVATQLNGVWTFFVYDVGGKLVAEYGGFQAMDEGGVKYVFQDRQGSTRAITNNTGVVQARMDYTAFGEEINANIGQRTTQQGFNSNNNLSQNNISQKYALTQRDKATGLDHTWFRKLENQAGRWTSPDPYNGSMNLGNPQSFNRYSYVENQPTNFVDPSGLQLIAFIYYVNDYREGMGHWAVHFMYIPDPTEGGGGGGGGGGGRGSSPSSPQKKCRDTLSLADANSDEGALSRLIFAEATDLARFGNFLLNNPEAALNNYDQELRGIAAVVHNRVNLINSRPDLNTGFASRGASITDVIYSRGASGTQFAGFTPSGISAGISNRIERALNSSSNSSECSKLRDAINTAKNYRRGSNSGLDQLYALRTAGTSSPGRNFQLVDWVAGSGNDFYTLTQEFLNPPKRRR
jgi:RHS repeat-associated protein